MFCPECGTKLPLIMSKGDVHDYVCLRCNYIWEWNPFQIDNAGYIRYELDQETELFSNLESQEQAAWREKFESLAI